MIWEIWIKSIYELISIMRFKKDTSVTDFCIRFIFSILFSKNMFFFYMSYYHIYIFFKDHENMDLSHYVTSPEWNLLDTKATKNTKYYPCCPEPYIDVTFTLEMKRRVSCHVEFCNEK